uniref:Uncharacterized protein n=1 Tax=Rhizophora mucronata TaxID=61149 RepID=A0A2P2JAR9_RHIMU
MCCTIRGCRMVKKTKKMTTITVQMASLNGESTKTARQEQSNVAFSTTAKTKD